MYKIINNENNICCPFKAQTKDMEVEVIDALTTVADGFHKIMTLNYQTTFGIEPGTCMPNFGNLSASIEVYMQDSTKLLNDHWVPGTDLEEVSRTLHEITQGLNVLSKTDVCQKVFGKRVLSIAYKALDVEVYSVGAIAEAMHCFRCTCLGHLVDWGMINDCLNTFTSKHPNDSTE